MDVIESLSSWTENLKGKFCPHKRLPSTNILNINHITQGYRRTELEERNGSASENQYMARKVGIDLCDRGTGNIVL